MSLEKKSLQKQSKILLFRLDTWSKSLINFSWIWKLSSWEILYYSLTMILHRNNFLHKDITAKTNWGWWFDFSFVFGKDAKPPVVSSG